MSVTIDCSTRDELIAIISDCKKTINYRASAFTRLIKMDNKVNHALLRTNY